MTIHLKEFAYDDGGRHEAGYKGYTGDCVTRSIAIATEQPYRHVYATLNELAKSQRPRKGLKRSSARTGVGRDIYQPYLEDMGWQWVSTMGIGTGCKVHLVADELPQGRLIVRVTRHITAVVDGVIRDTHNPARGGTRCVYGYFMKLE